MKYLTLPDPKDPQEGLYQARMVERAMTLFTSGGYSYETVKAWAKRTGNEELIREEMFVVRRPNHDIYVVDGERVNCTCPHFAQKGYCKHYMAIEYEMKQAEALEARHAYDEEF